MEYEIKIEISGLDEQTYNSIIELVKNLKNAKVTSQPLLHQTAVSGALPLISKVIEVAAAKAKEFHGGKSAFSAAYEEGWVDGAVWMRNEAERQ